MLPGLSPQGTASSSRAESWSRRSPRLRATHPLSSPAKREWGPARRAPAPPRDTNSGGYLTISTVVGSLVTLSTTEAYAITPLPLETVILANPRDRSV